MRFSEDDDNETDSSLSSSEDDAYADIVSVVSARPRRDAFSRE